MYPSGGGHGQGSGGFGGYPGQPPQGTVLHTTVGPVNVYKISQGQIK